VRSFIARFLLCLFRLQIFKALEGHDIFVLFRTINSNVSYKYIKIAHECQNITLDIYSITCMILEVVGVKSKVVKEKDDIVLILIASLKRQKITLKEKDIVVIASKIVALSQGRVVKIKGTNYKKGELKDLIQKEGKVLFPTNFCWLTFKDGHLIPNAGIDQSNVPKGKVVLWPRNSYKEAQVIQQKLKKHFRLKNLGIIIADSTCAPLRPGVHGISIGHFGFNGIDDCRNKKDIYGNKMRVTRRAMADSLATAALILMGETDDKKPFAVIKGAPVDFINRRERKSVIRLKSDLFYGMYSDEFIKFASKK